MFLCLFEPEIPHNVGAIIRLSVCFGSKLAIIRPMGFVWDPIRVQRSAMDYINEANIEFYDSFLEFKNAHNGRILATAIGKGDNYAMFDYQENDAILLGKESVGLPEYVYDAVDAIITIPIVARSLNLSNAAAILLAKAYEKRYENIV